MTYNPAFELPAQRFGEVLPHDLKIEGNRWLEELVDSIGKNAVAQAVTVEQSQSEETVEATGQYL